MLGGMKSLLAALIIFLVGLAQAQTNADLKMTLISPADFQVFQRQTAAGGKVVVEGMLEARGHAALTNLDKLEARLIGGTVSNDWKTLPFDNRVRRFRGELACPAGGWFRLELRLAGGGKIIFTPSIEHVGVGEIFLIAGQSNSANHGEEKQSAKNPLVVAFGNGIWQPARDPEPGASGKGGSFLPAFGDSMAEKFKVPIGLVPLGVGSTSVREWLPAGELMAAPPTTGMNTVTIGSNTWASTGALFDKISAAEKILGTNGFRAVLWHQGESDSHQPPDREITPAQYRSYLERVIAASRANAGWQVPWFVAQVSYHTPEDQSTPEFRAAQKSLVTDGIALAGPDTDALGPEFRQNNGRGIHFNAAGLQRHGRLWAESVSPWLEQQLAEK
jgi:hypothetical protein